VRRREFIKVVGGAAVGWPLAASAQQSKLPSIGIIDDSPVWDPFRQGLRDLGYQEGKNIAFEYRYAGGQPDRLAWAAAALVRRPVDVIATFGTPSTRAAKEATTTIPIVMVGIGDPVGAGLVASYSRPGGNITGNSILGVETAGKRLQLLKEVIPPLSRVAFLWNPDNDSHPAQLAELQVAAQTSGLKVIPVAVRSSNEFESAFTTILRERADAFLMTNDALHQLSIGRIIDFLAENRVPGMFLTREIVIAGGLMSYGASVPDLFRRGAVYVHKILQGTKPGDLPIEQPTKFELAINLKTAKALGLEVPRQFQQIADEVIE